MKYPASPSDWFKQNVKQSWRATSDHALMLAQEPLKKVHTICIRVALSTWKNRPKGYTTNPENHTRLFNRSLQRWIHWTIEIGISCRGNEHICRQRRRSLAIVVESELEVRSRDMLSEEETFFLYQQHFSAGFPLVSPLSAESSLVLVLPVHVFLFIH